MNSFRRRVALPVDFSPPTAAQDEPQETIYQPETSNTPRPSPVVVVRGSMVRRLQPASSLNPSLTGPNPNMLGYSPPSPSSGSSVSLETPPAAKWAPSPGVTKRRGRAATPKQAVDSPPPPSPPPSCPPPAPVESSLLPPPSIPLPSPPVKKKAKPAWAAAWTSNNSDEASGEADAVSNRQSKIKNWGNDDQPNRNQSKTSVPQMVLTVEGQWKLEGHEADVKSMAESVPILQARLSGGVKAEQEQEMKALENLYKGGDATLSRLQREGVVLCGLSAKPAGQLYRQQLWRLASRQNDLPHYKFKAGEGILLTRFSQDRPGSYKEAMEGTVVQAKRDHLIIAVDQLDSEALASNEKTLWRCDQSIRDTTAQRQLEAIQRLSMLPQSPSEILIRCIISGSLNSSLIAEQPPIWVRDKEWRDDAKEALALETGLNSSQRRAVAKSMTSGFTLWQGPPGTGKTRTLLALIKVLVNTSAKKIARWKTMGSVLAAADTNAAVDNLVEGLSLIKGLRVVRVGSPAKVRESLRHLTLEALAEDSTKRGQKAKEAREAARKMMDELKSRNDKGQSIDEDLMRKCRKDFATADTALKEAMAEVLDRAHVICATCTGSGDPSLGSRSFRCVIIDESSQATEPATLMPLTRGAECVIMAGDQKQLPPTVISQKALEYNLDVTLFERVSGNGVATMLLDTQYRMHPSISLFPSQHFYGGKLKDGVGADTKPPPRGFPWPAFTSTKEPMPVAVVSVEGHEEKAGATGFDPASKASKGSGSDGVSFRNTLEADVSVQAAHSLLSSGDIESVAILTPYKGQVRLLENLLRERASHFNSLMGHVVVSSVDGYQGREADAVVFTTVRSNKEGSIGFVSDLRRLNVAITRPRRGLVIVCNPETLKEGSPKHWGRYVSQSLI
jgi:DNA polymerase III delta prime subunit